jgi:glycerophosphoryl diester phosphodiesterase
MEKDSVHMKSYLSPAGFRIFAHRGSTEGGAVENTLAAFKYAVSKGITYLETDVQATKDGVAVLFHDKNLHRLAGLRLRISAFTYNELRNLITPSGKLQIPTLSEVLQTFPNAKFNIDFKTEDAITPGLKAIVEAGAESRVLVSSFSPARRALALSKLAGAATSADAWLSFKLWVWHKLGAVALFNQLANTIDALQVPVRMGPIRFDDSALIKKLKTIGVEVHFWTINDVREAKRLKELGAAGIVTDCGKLMAEAFASDL